MLSWAYLFFNRIPEHNELASSSLTNGEGSMKKLKIVAVAFLLLLSAPVMADTMVVRDNGSTYRFTCPNQCILNLSDGGWWVTDSLGGPVYYVII